MEKNLIERLEAVVTRLEANSIITGRGFAAGAESLASSQTEALDPAILALDALVENSVMRFVSIGGKIGGSVGDLTKILQESFAVLRVLLIEAKRIKKPEKSDVPKFLKPLNACVLKASYITEGRSCTDHLNHLQSVTNSLTALAWIAYTGKDCGMSLPIAHVEESWQMAEFYNNKVLVEYKNKDPDHVEWAKALKEIYLPGLRDFVKTFYPLGVVWSLNGNMITSASTSSGPSPPAPPAPKAGSLFSSDAASKHPKEGMSAVFQEISSGKSVTAGLRKVTPDLKSKNRTDRTGMVGATEAVREIPSNSTFKLKTESPKMELQMGRKWAVENQFRQKSLVIDNCDSKQSVYVFGCRDSVLQIKGKVNNITIDKCNKMGVLFTDVVAALEVVNCNGVEVQCQGYAPTISVDNTSGCQLYLSKDSLNVSITTSKSSETNVMVPGSGTQDDDWVEHSLPQQFVHTFKEGRFATSPLSHSGG